VELTPLAQALKGALLKRAVLHADETPVPMLKPGLGRTHQAYMWSYGTTQFDPLPLVVYDFAESRGGYECVQGWESRHSCRT
jgi:transposase